MMPCRFGPSLLSPCRSVWQVRQALLNRSCPESGSLSWAMAGCAASVSTAARSIRGTAVIWASSQGHSKERTAIARVPASTDRAHRDPRAGLHLPQRLHVAHRRGKDVARARQPRLVALRDRRAAEADGDAMAIRPVRDL